MHRWAVGDIGQRLYIYFYVKDAVKVTTPTSIRRGQFPKSVLIIIGLKTVTETNLKIDFVSNQYQYFTGEK